MGELRTLPGVEVAPDGPEDGVVELLETWLEKARRGEVKSVAIAAEMANGKALHDWWRGTGAHSMMLFGAVAYLQGLLHQEIVKGARERG